MSLSRLFNRKAACAALSTGALLIGAAGVLSGAWQAYTGGPAAAAGLFGGLVSLGVGVIGLRSLKRDRPSLP